MNLYIWNLLLEFKLLRISFKISIRDTPSQAPMKRRTGPHYWIREKKLSLKFLKLIVLLSFCIAIGMLLLLIAFPLALVLVRNSIS
jgi:hypothetical protein